VETVQVSGSGLAEIRAAMFDLVGPPPRLTISEWADANRVLSGESSSEPGRWRTDRAPYQREMMDVITSDDYETVVIMTSAQVGKSEILLNAIGFYADHDPAPMLQLQPTLEMAAAFSKDRVGPMFRSSPALRGKINDSRSRKTKDNASATVFHKKFPGGQLTMCGANSPASLASRPIRIVLADEIDRYPISAGTEGDPLNLARKRTTTFHNRKIVLTSTPTVKGASRIEMAFEDSDQRKFYVPCPHCQLMQPLVWANVRWSKDDAGKWDGNDPVYCCDGCGAAIQEQEKSAMLKRGRWVAEGFSDRIAGFHLNELYSPWRKWRDMVADFLEAKKDSELLRVFINTSLGETFEEQGETVEPHALLKRKEAYAAPVPAGAVVLVAGVDTQGDRLEATILGLGGHDECWAIGHHVLFGDPSLPAVWQNLDDLLISGEWEHESGNKLGVSASCIDSGGHHTKQVYEYCKRRKSRRVFAIKGVGGFGRPAVSAPSRKRSGRDSRQVELWTLGVDEIKSIVYSRLATASPGPGYIHFPMNDCFGPEYFEQLTAEKIVTRFRKGVPYREWQAMRRRNEALDCMAYAWAAKILLNPKIDALARRLTDEPAASEPQEKTGRGGRSNRTTRRGGFVNRWK